MNTISHTAHVAVPRTALAIVASGLLLSLSACAGAGADKPAQPPADGKGVSATVPRAMDPVMPAPTAPPASAMAPETDADAGTCNPEAARQFVGQPASAANIETARAAAAPSGTVRVIAPGQAVTMDFRPDRLNVDVDAQRVILKLRCG